MDASKEHDGTKKLSGRGLHEQWLDTMHASRIVLPHSNSVVAALRQIS